jgi:hypothetical protein
LKVQEPEVSDINYSDTKGRVIPDSGCRRSVAGKRWHDEIQERLAARGLRPVEMPCSDLFRFGDGRVVKATRSWKYPVGIYGRNGVLNMAEVPKDCPPLLSYRCMGELGVVMNFRDQALTVEGETRPMQKLSSGHPALDVEDYDEKGLFDEEFLVAETDTTDAEDDYDGVVKKGVRKRLKRVVEALATTTEKPQEVFKVTEIWTWKQQVLAQAELDPRWRKGSAISLETGFDLRTHEGQAAAWKMLEKELPDVLILACPCSPWSALQNMQKDKDAVKEKQARDMLFLEFAVAVARWQDERGRLFVIENPAASRAWKQDVMQDLVKD